MDFANADHWILIARANEGKSTFATQMSPEYLVADLDGRWDEQAKNVLGVAHVIKKSETLAIVTEMEKYAATNKNIQTVIYDSGTAVLDYIQSKGRLMEAEAKPGSKFNLNDVHKLKADTMRVLRLAALKFHCNVLWIFHLEDGKMSGKDRVRTTLPATELERMKSNLNAILSIVKDGKTGQRGIRIEWCRYNSNVAAGQVIWDTDSMWRGVPQRIHSFIRGYTGKEGYSGNAYSTKYIMTYLAGKDINFLNVAEMKTKLGIEVEPDWWDRNSWARFIENATAPVEVK